MSFPSTSDEPLPSESRVTWGLREIGLSIVLALAAIVVAVVTVAAPATAIWGEDSTGADVGNAISQIVLDLLVVGGMFWLVRRSGASLVALGLRKPVRDAEAARPIGGEGIPWGHLAGMVLTALIACYVCLIGYVAIVKALGLGFLEPDDQIPEDFLQKDIVVAFLGIGVVLVAPVCEELFFRGFMFGGLRRMWGFVPAGLVSGLVFSIAHTQPGLIIPFAAIGFILAFLYQRTGSIFVSMSLHFLFNLISFTLLVANARDNQVDAAISVLHRVAL